MKTSEMLINFDEHSSNLMQRLLQIDKSWWHFDETWQTLMKVHKICSIFKVLSSSLMKQWMFIKCYGIFVFFNKFNENDEICVVESVKAASDIYAPIDGEIMEVNNNLESDAAIINQEAENTGWIFKMKVSNLSQYDELMTEDDYKKFLGQ